MQRNIQNHRLHFAFSREFYIGFEVRAQTTTESCQETMAFALRQKYLVTLSLSCKLPATEVEFYSFPSWDTILAFNPFLHPESPSQSTQFAFDFKLQSSGRERHRAMNIWQAHAAQLQAEPCQFRVCQFFYQSLLIPKSQQFPNYALTHRIL